MGYAVDYIPSFNRRPRRQSASRGKCKITEKDLRNQVAWNLDRFERDWLTVQSIKAADLIAVLRLDKIVSGYDRGRGGMNALLKLRKDAALPSRNEDGGIVFDVAATVEALHAYAGV